MDPRRDDRPTSSSFPFGPSVPAWSEEMNLATTLIRRRMSDAFQGGRTVVRIVLPAELEGKDPEFAARFMWGIPVVYEANWAAPAVELEDATRWATAWPALAEPQGRLGVLEAIRRWASLKDDARERVRPALIPDSAVRREELAERARLEREAAGVKRDTRCPEPGCVRDAGHEPFGHRNEAGDRWPAPLEETPSETDPISAVIGDSSPDVVRHFAPVPPTWAQPAQRSLCGAWQFYRELGEHGSAWWPSVSCTECWAAKPAYEGSDGALSTPAVFRVIELIGERMAKPEDLREARERLVADSAAWPARDAERAERADRVLERTDLDELPTIECRCGEKIYLDFDHHEEEHPPAWIAPFVAWADGGDFLAGASELGFDELDFNGADVPARVISLISAAEAERGWVPWAIDEETGKPFTLEKLDALHDRIGLGQEWQASKRRAEMADHRLLSESAEFVTLGPWQTHGDGRHCGYHNRLRCWTFERDGWSWECLRDHPARGPSDRSQLRVDVDDDSQLLRLAQDASSRLLQPGEDIRDVLDAIAHALGSEYVRQLGG